jgi:hypothetical protein
MTDEELIALDKMGFIPGPGESEESFLMRVGKTQKKFAEGSWIPDAHWAWVREYLGQLFDVKPLYICAFYSNHRLAPWQGGAAWIDGKALSAIQLRENLRKGSYLGIYRREEILAHEAVHAARSGFNENRCEEFFAYMTSEKKWRRILGPIVQSPWEVWPFLLGALLGAVWPIGYLVAGVWAGLGFFRLIKQHLRLRRASLNLLKEVGKAEIARAVLFRLTDREIKQLSQGVSIHLLCDKQTDLRGRVIRNYLKEGLWQKESS